jgi:hypothetical protein
MKQMLYLSASGWSLMTFSTHLVSFKIKYNGFIYNRMNVNTFYAANFKYKAHIYAMTTVNICITA